MLQQVQNPAPTLHVVYLNPVHELHWLPVRMQIGFSILLITFKPVYLSDLISVTFAALTMEF